MSGRYGQRSAAYSSPAGGLGTARTISTGNGTRGSKPQFALDSFRPAGYEDSDEDDDDDLLCFGTLPSGNLTPASIAANSNSVGAVASTQGRISNSNICNSLSSSNAVQHPTPTFTWLQDLTNSNCISPVHITAPPEIVGGRQKPALVLIDDLRVAVTNGMISEVKRLLDQASVDVEEIVSSDWPLLVHAASSAQPDSVQFLLHGCTSSSSVDPIVSRNGSTDYPALSAVCGSPIQDVPRVSACVRLLLTSGADLKATDRNGMSALMHAVLARRTNIVRLLLERGACVNDQDRNGFTALMYAAMSGQIKITQLLISAGADTMLRTVDGSRAVHLAAQAGHRDIEVLLQNDHVISRAPVSDDEEEDQDRSSSVDQQVFAPAPPSFDFTMDELEVFFSALDLRELVPVLRRADITFQTLLRYTDNDLLRIGVKNLTVRKKIIDALNDVHKRNWETNSLTNITYQRKVSCPEAVALLGNITHQAALIASTVGFLSDQITTDNDIIKKPSATESGGGEGPDNSTRELSINTEETAVNVSNLYKEIVCLKTRLKMICRDRPLSQPDLIVSEKPHSGHISSVFDRKILLPVTSVIGCSCITAAMLYNKNNIVTYLNSFGIKI